MNKNRNHARRPSVSEVLLTGLGILVLVALALSDLAGSCPCV